MTTLNIVFTNNDPDNDQVLPEALGSYTVPAGSTLTRNYNTRNFRSIADNVTAEALAELERLLERPVTLLEADTDVDAAGAAVYNITLPAKLKAGTVVILIPDDADGYIELTDDGAGALAESGGTGTGTVNYNTGAVVVNNDLTSATINSEGDILASYSYLLLSAVITDAGLTYNGVNTLDAIDSL